MKILRIIFIIFIMLFAQAAFVSASNISSDGYCNGIRLSGRVKVVKHFADLKVKVVRNFPDLRVKKVANFPDEIGEWQFVNFGEDFTIEFVEHFPDIRIQFVNAFPGVD